MTLRFCNYPIPNKHAHEWFMNSLIGNSVCPIAIFLLLKILSFPIDKIHFLCRSYISPHWISSLTAKIQHDIAVLQFPNTELACSWLIFMLTHCKNPTWHCCFAISQYRTSMLMSDFYFYLLVILFAQWRFFFYWKFNPFVLTKFIFCVDPTFPHIE